MAGSPPPPPHMVVAPVFERFHSFKEFIALQKDELEPEKAVDLYDQYKYDFKLHTARTVFHQNLDLGLIKERYGPESLNQLAQEKRRHGRMEAQKLLTALENREFSDLTYDFFLRDPKTASLLLKPEPRLNGRVSAMLSLDRQELKAEDGELFDVCASPYYGENLNAGHNVLVLKKLPGAITRKDLQELCKDLEGVRDITLVPSCLIEENQAALVLQASKSPQDCTEEELQLIEQIMSECYVKSRASHAPLIPLQTAWVTFDTEQQTDVAELALERRSIGDICTCRPMRVSSQIHKKIRVCSVEDSTRSGKDLQLAKGLIEKLDSEFCIYSELPARPSDELSSKAEEKPEENNAGKTEKEAEPDSEISREPKNSDKSDIMEIEGTQDIQPGDGNDGNHAQGSTDAHNLTSTENRKEKLSKEDSSGLASGLMSVHKEEPQGETMYEEDVELVEVKMQTNPFLELVARLHPDSREHQLDFCIFYLRKVHMMDFYSGKIAWSQRELLETTGIVTLRLKFGSSSEADLTVMDDVPPTLKLQASNQLEFDARIAQIKDFPYALLFTPLDERHPIFVELWAAFCREKTLQVDAEKFRCGICRKLFKGAEFVYKHLKNKHGAEVEPVLNVANSELMKQGFEVEDAKLFLFVVQTNDFLKVFQNTRPPSIAAHAGGHSYGPTRRNRSGARGGPMGPLGSDEPRPYRDWDAPRTRLEDRAAGGNFRKTIRYDDL